MECRSWLPSILAWRCPLQWLHALDWSTYTDYQMACHFKTLFIIITVIVEKMQLSLALSTQNGLVQHPDYTMASITVQSCDGFHLSSFQNWISWTKVTKIKVETNMPTCRYDPVNRCQSHPLQNGQFITDLGHSTLLSDKTRSQKWKHHRKNTTKNHQGRKHQHKKPVSTNSTLKTCTINFYIYYYKTCSIKCSSSLSTTFHFDLPICSNLWPQVDQHPWSWKKVGRPFR